MLGRILARIRNAFDDGKDEAAPVSSTEDVMKTAAAGTGAATAADQALASPAPAASAAFPSGMTAGQGTAAPSGAAAKPIIIPGWTLQSADPRPAVQAVQMFTSVLVTQHGLSETELPPRAGAFFVAARLVESLAEGALPKFLKQIDQATCWIDPCIGLLREAGLSVHALALEKIHQWMQRHPGQNPAQALAAGDPELGMLQQTLQQMAGQLAYEQGCAALVQHVRTWPDLMPVDSARDIHWRALMDRHYPYTDDWAAHILRQFYHPVNVAASLLMISQQQLLMAMKELSTSPFPYPAYLLFAPGDTRFLLAIKERQVELHEVLPNDLSSLGLDQLVQPQDRARLQQAIERLDRQGAMLTTGRMLASLDIDLLDRCIDVAKATSAPDALGLLLERDFPGRPKVAVWWLWPIAPEELAPLVEKMRSKLTAKWRVVIMESETGRTHIKDLLISPEGAGLIDPR